jgi:16S rRNA (cytosine1402-N4)-methyltransferase
MSRDLEPHQSSVEHIPVLLDETIEGLAIRPGGRYVDGTLGGGSHAQAILEASAPDGQLLGLDADPEAIERCRKRLRDYTQRATLIQTNFSELGAVATLNGFEQVDGALLDLGLSSQQIGSAKRGFSFQLNGPLDMRFGLEGSSAMEMVNALPEAELAHILWFYGEEHQSRRIAREIVRRRPVSSTLELAGTVAEAVGSRGKLHPATKTFMALRIATNRELEVLEAVLPQILDLLAQGSGRMAVISYHSLEDRLVKQWMFRESRDCVCPEELPQCRCDHKATLRLVSRKPIRPSEEETKRNPRSRSARLRLAEKLPR